MTTEYIEEIIEESYLLGLSESEIRANLDRFVETCGSVIRNNVHDKTQMQALAGKLARARALSLIEDRHGEDDGDDMIGEGNAVRSSREQLAEKVARNKRLILRAIGECDVKLVSLIEQERFPDRGEAPGPPMTVPIRRGDGMGLRDFVLRGSYALAILFVLLIVYLVLLQNI